MPEIAAEIRLLGSLHGDRPFLYRVLIVTQVSYNFDLFEGLASAGMELGFFFLPVDWQKDWQS